MGRAQLNFIQYLIQHSLACTVMNKLKLSSRAQVFKKFGSSIEVPIAVSDGLENRKQAIRTACWDNPQCTICKTYSNVEMHHRRPIKQAKTDGTLKGIESNLARKQIPLCKSCHIKVHAGNYDGPAIY